MSYLKMIKTQSTTIKRTRKYSNILLRRAKTTMTRKHFNTKTCVGFIIILAIKRNQKK